MRYLIAFIVLTTSTAAAALAPWDNCPADSYPLVRNPAASHSALQTQIPAGDYYPTELVEIVRAYRSGEACGPTGATWSDTTGVENSDNNNFTASKQCRLGPSVFDTVFASGSRVCSKLECPLTVGASYPWASSSQQAPSGNGTFCSLGCKLEIRGLGLVIGASQPIRDILVLDDFCSSPYSAFAHSDRAECQTLNGQEVCTSPGAASTPSARINDEQFVQQTVPPGEAFCTPTRCPDNFRPVVTAPDDSQIARSDTPSPPAPDTGTEGQRAPADLTVLVTDQNGTQHSYDYWSPPTVIGSTTYVPGSGDDGGGDDGGGGDDDGDGEGGGGIDGGLDCGEQPQCTGEFDPIQCYHSQKLWESSCALRPASADALQAEAARFTDPTPEDGTVLDTVVLNAAELIKPFEPGPCPSDLPVTLPAPFNATVIVPLSSWCELLRVLGVLLHLSAAFAALRLIAV